MGNTDGTKNNTWTLRAEEKRLHNYSDPRKRANTGQPSEVTRNQSERTHRANCSNFPLLPVGEILTGGTVRQLIDDYRDQVASKQHLIKQAQNEIDYLLSRINDFEQLAQELELPNETTEEEQE